MVASFMSIRLKRVTCKDLSNTPFHCPFKPDGITRFEQRGKDGGLGVQLFLSDNIMEGLYGGLEIV